MIVDDSIAEKPHTDENDIVCGWSISRPDLPHATLLS
jgi:hypothetical protein